MPSVTEHNQRKALDRWARESGWADFATFISMGGSILACRDDLLHKRDGIDLALAGLQQLSPVQVAHGPRRAEVPIIGEDALKRAEAEQIGDEVEPHNAAAQGAEA